MATATSSAGGPPTFGVHSGDPRFLYVGEQNGRIRILDFNQPNPLSADRFSERRSAVLRLRLCWTTPAPASAGCWARRFIPISITRPTPTAFASSTRSRARPSPARTPHFLPPKSETPAYNHQSVIREWTANAPERRRRDHHQHRVPSRVVMRIAKPGQFHNGGAWCSGPTVTCTFRWATAAAAAKRRQRRRQRRQRQPRAHQSRQSRHRPAAGPARATPRIAATCTARSCASSPRLDADPAHERQHGRRRLSRPQRPIRSPPTRMRLTRCRAGRTTGSTRFTPTAFAIRFASASTATTGEALCSRRRPGPQHVLARGGEPDHQGGNYGWVIKSGTEINDRPPAHRRTPIRRTSACR